MSFLDLFRKKKKDTETFKIGLVGQMDAYWCTYVSTFDSHRAAELGAKILYDTRCDLIEKWPLCLRVTNEDEETEWFLVDRRTFTTYISKRTGPSERSSFEREVNTHS